MRVGTLDGRVALVTGAASGIGRASAERLAEEGAAVLATDIQDEAGEAVAAGIRERGEPAVYARHDVASEDEWIAAVERATSELGRVDSVHPGFIDTPIIEQALGTPIEEAMLSSTPMGRLGRPEEVAAVVAFSPATMRPS